MVVLDVSLQASLSMGFPRQEYWSGFAISSSRESPQPRDWTSVSCLAGGFFTTEPQGKPSLINSLLINRKKVGIDNKIIYVVSSCFCWRKEVYSCLCRVSDLERFLSRPIVIVLELAQFICVFYVFHLMFVFSDFSIRNTLCF